MDLAKEKMSEERMSIYDINPNILLFEPYLDKALVGTITYGQDDHAVYEFNLMVKAYKEHLRTLPENKGLSDDELLSDALGLVQDAQFAITTGNGSGGRQTPFIIGLFTSVTLNK